MQESCQFGEFFGKARRIGNPVLSMRRLRLQRALIAQAVNPDSTRPSGKIRVGSVPIQKAKGRPEGGRFIR
jgi:hypothetical protein